MIAPGLFTDKPPQWREQDALAERIGRTRSKERKRQLVSALCASLTRMTGKPTRRTW